MEDEGVRLSPDLPLHSLEHSITNESRDRVSLSIDFESPLLGRPESPFFSDRRHNEKPQSQPRNHSSTNDQNASSAEQKLYVYTDELLAHFEQDIFNTQPPFLAGTAASTTVPVPDVEASRIAGTRQLVISFAGLQRMRLRKLQIQLVSHVMAMHFERREPKNWEEQLKEYITAVRDYDYIKTCADRRVHDPFIFTSTRELERAILKLQLENIPLERRQNRQQWAEVFLQEAIYNDNTTRGSLNKEQQVQQAFQRLGMAVFGGFFLVGPMWLMVLQNELYTTLITTTALVFGFGLIIAIGPMFITGSSISVETVFSATAAYAAVLVVFVGTTTPIINSS